MNIQKAGEVLQTRERDVERYAYMIKRYEETNVDEDDMFQRKFNAFYRVRRGESWQKVFYEIFAKNRERRLTFAEIICELYERTGNIESSFSSKMLATIHTEMPIWDKYVLQNIGLKLTGKTKKEKLQNAIDLYEKMVEWYAVFLDSEKGKECVMEFNKRFPQYEYFSEIKKVDFILWCMR